MGLGRVWEWSWVPDKLTMPAKPSVVNLALSRRSVNICYIEKDGKPTYVLFCIIWVLSRIICLFCVFSFYQQRILSYINSWYFMKICWAEWG